MGCWWLTWPILGFVSLFPLLLVLVTLLGLVASNDPAVRHQVLGAVAQ